MNIITPSSSPSLSSSSATDTLELNVSEAGMGCLSGIMRRLLCHNAAARQAGREEEEAKQVSRELCNKVEQKPAPSPSLVARLMGLDSMPVFPYTPPSSMGRSRSTSSLESWPLFNESAKMRTSVSFRETPTFLRQENEDFLLLTFTAEPSEEKVNKELKQVRQMKREKVNRREDKKNKNRGRQINEELSSKHKQRASNCKQRHSRRKAVDSVEVDFTSSQNSSPDSVLDNNAFGIDDKYYEDNKLEKRSSRKKLSSELDRLQWSAPRIKFNVVVDDGGLRSQSEGRDRKNRMRKHEKPGHSSPESRELIFRCAGEDMKRSNWFSTEKCESEEAEEIAFITTLHILDFLLQEVVNELYLN